MIALVREPINVEALVNSVRSVQYGAALVFQGVVRADDHDRKVRALFYEAYESAALAEMNVIVTEVQERFSPCAISMLHRLGHVFVGEVSVAVTVATPHRSDAFDACRYAIDNLKARVPIWKKEEYADGGASWRANPVAESADPKG
ncbi:MAG: hypothetical protein DLM50_09275 [Candidatus Meridianibacter frigidus]|nr:MAG: hypothetical protein DLM50_09275 [Candidatus Eremiobacteraeota bacterium]